MYYYRSTSTSYLGQRNSHLAAFVDEKNFPTIALEEWPGDDGDEKVDGLRMTL